MIQTAQSKLRIKQCAEALIGQSEGGPELIRRTFILDYEGELQGQGVLEELMVRFTEKRASMTGLMRFTGSVGMYQGSCVLRHTGKWINGRVTASQTVVPGSATGSLKGLRGEMQLASGLADGSSSVFRYRFA